MDQFRGKTAVAIILIAICSSPLESVRDFFLHFSHVIQNASSIIIQKGKKYFCLTQLQSVKLAALPVTVLPNNLLLKNGNIYLVPGDKALVVLQGVTKICSLAINKRPCDLNKLLQSIGTEAKKQSAAFYFSNNKKDAAAGIKPVEKAGGLSIFQKFNFFTDSNSLTGCGNFQWNSVRHFSGLTKVVKDFYVEKTKASSCGVTGLVMPVQPANKMENL